MRERQERKRVEVISTGDSPAYFGLLLHTVASVIATIRILLPNGNGGEAVPKKSRLKRGLRLKRLWSICWYFDASRSGDLHHAAHVGSACCAFFRQ
ncbi:MAG: hypothetical protein L3K26_15075, partial [Candidatus Hydrogenedentes bacterium]|nr:hypothetical protein [Candidatus Hydrogenedentota bacterium]